VPDAGLVADDENMRLHYPSPRREANQIVMNGTLTTGRAAVGNYRNSLLLWGGVAFLAPERGDGGGDHLVLVAALGQQGQQPLPVAARLGEAALLRCGEAEIPQRLRLLRVLRVHALPQRHGA